MDLVDATWVQAKVDWLLSLAPESDIQIVARILVWCFVAYMLVVIYKKATK